MENESCGNVLVMQSGSPSVVLNSALAGVITEALNYEEIAEIYGSLHGIRGILNEELVDLAEESQQTIRGLRSTPGAALGSTADKLQGPEESDRIFEVFRAHNIRYFFCIGDSEAQHIANEIDQLAKQKEYKLHTIGIPASIHNDIPMTDHCPGYGSAIKYLATFIREMSFDHESVSQHDFVSIVEVSGSWLAAGTTLAKHRNEPSDAPHFILFPEIPLDSEVLLEKLRDLLKNQRYALIVTTEQMGTSLQSLVEKHLSVKTNLCQLGPSQRMAAHCASKVDHEEAFLCGQAAVKAAINGKSGKMITVIRKDAEPYCVETGLTPLETVLSSVKALPRNWVSENGTSLNYSFVKYATPLLQGEMTSYENQGLPQLVQLNGYRVEAKIPAGKMM